MRMPNPTWIIGQRLSFHVFDIIRFCHTLGNSLSWSCVSTASVWSSRSSIDSINSVMSIIPSPSPSTPSIMASTSSISNTSPYFSSSMVRSSASEIIPFPSASSSLNMRWAEISCSSIISASAANGCLLNDETSTSWASSWVSSSLSPPSSSSSSSSRSKSSLSISSSTLESSMVSSSDSASSSSPSLAVSVDVSSTSEASSPSSSSATWAASECSSDGSSSEFSGGSSPERILSNSSKSITPFPSASISSTKRSTWEGGKSAKFKLSKPRLSSCESMVPSLFSSNLSKSFRMFTPVSATHWRRMSTTSSATNRTPHSGHWVESNGTKALHAPHSPSASSDTPENDVPHSGQTSESIGIMARQAPHSAMPIDCFSSSDTFPPTFTTKNGNIMIDGDWDVEGVIP